MARRIAFFAAVGLVAMMLALASAHRPVMGLDGGQSHSLRPPVLPQFGRANPRPSGQTEDPSSVFNVVSYGANGDGTTDDSAAFQAAFDAWAAAPYGGTVFMPPGLYLLTTTVNISSPRGFPLSFVGSGWSSNILWSKDTDLLVWSTTSPVTHLTASAFAVTSIGGDKSNGSAALRFTAGVVKSVFEDLLFYGRGGVPGTTLQASLLGTCIDTGLVADTLSINSVVMWFLRGTGVIVGRGSEVRVIGGRIIGQASRVDGSIGVHVTGNNGGVHVVSTDVIALEHGVVLDSSNGAGSNREIFINQATMDSNGRGLSIYDDSYVSIAGCWAASSSLDNIWISPEATGAILVVSGGTIFNACAISGKAKPNECNGITINAGEVTLTGVDIRFNKGIGVWVPNSGVKHLSVTGCHLFNNGQAMSIIAGAQSYLVSSNIFHDNTAKSAFGSMGGGAIVTNNILDS